MRSKLGKKIFLLGVVTTASLIGVTTVQAQDSEAFLSQIATNTANTNTNVTSGNSTINSTLTGIASTSTSILGALNTQIQNFQQYYIQTIFPDLYSFLQSWMAQDDTQATSTFQSSFSQIGQLIIQQLNASSPIMPQINNSLLGSNLTANQNTLWYANDLTYSTLLGNPYFQPDPRLKKIPGLDPAYNYVLNASAIGVTHVKPYTNPQDQTTPANWTGSATSRQKYQNYYNTVMAVESFNGYVLGNVYSDIKNGNQFNTLQTQLIQEATDSQNWFAQIAGKETLGQILRQILLFESQSFILSTQLIQIEKQMLTAQVMTNALLIGTNVDKEYVMQAYAQGVTPTM